MKKPWTSAEYWLAQPAFLQHPGAQHRDDTTHNCQGLLTSLIKKVPRRLAHSLSYGGLFLFEVPFPHTTIAYVKLT